MAKSRNTVVTLPDGTVAKRGSATTFYTWAGMQTEDNHAFAKVQAEWADKLTEVHEKVTAMIAAGDLSGLVRKVTSQNGRGERFYSSYLPGDQDRRWSYWLPDWQNRASWSEYIDKAL